MKIGIDGDIVVYEAGHSAETRTYVVTDLNHKELFRHSYMAEVRNYLKQSGKSEAVVHITKLRDAPPVAHTLQNVNQLIGSIIERVKDHFDVQDVEVVVYLTGEGNYRSAMYPMYKANRHDDDKPLHYDAIKEHLIKAWDAIVVNGMEADDALGMMQEDSGTMICTKDKDLDVVTGWHYNWMVDQFYYIGSDDADYCFWKQMLVGDSGDNIPGIPKIGKKTADKLLMGCESPEDWSNVVKQKYKDAGMYDDWFDLNCRLIWIQQNRQEPWNV